MPSRQKRYWWLEDDDRHFGESDSDEPSKESSPETTPTTPKATQVTVRIHMIELVPWNFWFTQIFGENWKYDPYALREWESIRRNPPCPKDKEQ